MNYFEAPHWTEMSLEQAAEWEDLAPNFSPKELASKGDGSLKISKVALILLQTLRDVYNAPLIINSGYRDPKHNSRVGGSPTSQHVFGRAFDIHIDDTEMGRELEDLAIKTGFTAIGRYKTFIHVDSRPPKADGSLYQWGSW